MVVGAAACVSPGSFVLLGYISNHGIAHARVGQAAAIGRRSAAGVVVAGVAMQCRDDTVAGAMTWAVFDERPSLYGAAATIFPLELLLAAVYWEWTYSLAVLLLMHKVRRYYVVFPTVESCHEKPAYMPVSVE